MQFKIHFILVLTGLVINIIVSAKIVYRYFLLTKGTLLGQQTLFFSTGNEWDIFANTLQLIFMYALVTLAVSLILLFFIAKIARNPKRLDFFATIILGIISVGSWGGILILIGGILGLNKLKNTSQ
ncbi:MAG: hypothetical protein AAB352_01215 [Patescibacteria group bacterium]